MVVKGERRERQQLLVNHGEPNKSAGQLIGSAAAFDPADGRIHRPLSLPAKLERLCIPPSCIRLWKFTGPGSRNPGSVALMPANAS